MTLAHWFDEERQIAPALDPAGEEMPDDGLRGRPNDVVLSSFLRRDGDDGELGGKPLHVLCLPLDEALRDEQREVGVLVAVALNMSSRARWIFSQMA